MKTHMDGASMPEKDEPHWSRLPLEAEVNADENEKLISQALMLTEYRICECRLRALLCYAAEAKWHHEERKLKAATLRDSRRELKAMAAMDDAHLLDALSKCSSLTYRIYNESQSRISYSDWAAQAGALQNGNREPAESLHQEPHWVPSDDLGGGETVGPRIIRKAVTESWDRVAAERGCRGPKHKPHHIELTRTSLNIWNECKKGERLGLTPTRKMAMEYLVRIDAKPNPKWRRIFSYQVDVQLSRAYQRAWNGYRPEGEKRVRNGTYGKGPHQSPRTAFIIAMFKASGIVLSPKRIERLLAEAGR
jgi:hypothetical protein